MVNKALFSAPLWGSARNQEGTATSARQPVSVFRLAVTHLNATLKPGATSFQRAHDHPAEKKYETGALRLSVFDNLLQTGQRLLPSLF